MKEQSATELTFKEEVEVGLVVLPAGHTVQLIATLGAMDPPRRRLLGRTSLPPSLRYCPCVQASHVLLAVQYLPMLQYSSWVNEANMTARSTGLIIRVRGSADGEPLYMYVNRTTPQKWTAGPTPT